MAGKGSGMDVGKGVSHGVGQPHAGCCQRGILSGCVATFYCVGAVINTMPQMSTCFCVPSVHSAYKNVMFRLVILVSDI